VINAAKAGTGISITGSISKPDDGVLEIFILDAKNIRTLAQATTRMLHLNKETHTDFLRQGKKIQIKTTPDQPVWTDGEYVGRTPISMEIVPGALRVVVPSLAA
jgi:diacylglycerol kinase family enzyme